MTINAQKSQEIQYAIDRLKVGIETMMQNEQVSGEAMVIGLLENAASLAVAISTLRRESEELRHIQYRHLARGFREAWRRNEKTYLDIIQKYNP